MRHYLVTLSFFNKKTNLWSTKRTYKIEAIDLDELYQIVGEDYTDARLIGPDCIQFYG